MFGFLTKCFRKSAANPAVTESAALASAPASAAPGPSRPAVPRQANSRPLAGTFPPRATHAPAAASGHGMKIPLRAIVAQLPTDLQARAREYDTASGEVEISLPIERVLPQLAHGAVRVTFGELRQLAPPGSFVGGNDSDTVQITLPLSEVLSRINPALLTRRPVQKKIEIPAEIVSPFGTDGHGEGVSVGVDKPETAPASPLARNRFATPQRPAATAPAMPQRTSVPTAPTVPHTPPPPAAPAQPPAPINLPPEVAAFSFTRTPSPSPAPKPLPTLPPPQKTMPSAPPLSGMGAALAASARSDGMGSVLSVPLADFAPGWPEAVRQEIAQLGVSRASVAIPTALLEISLKTGKAAFTWKQIRGWIQPAVPPSVSVNDPAMLELPLKIIAPIFLSKQLQGPKFQKRVTLDQKIPNVFSGGGNPDAPDAVIVTPPVAHDTPRPADTNYYVWGEVSDTLLGSEETFRQGTAAPGTAFLKRYATPNEIVVKAAAVEGVAGALITLPDGLLVASRVPPELQAETLAAFVPQIFGKVSQCTKELRMGDLNNLKFTVGRVPWRIFRVGSIFFAAFGRDGERMDAAKLAALAAELDRNPRPH